jgi:signal transduction histidine kinase
MRRFIPDSLAAWALLTLIVGLVVTQVSTLFVVAHGRETRQQMMEFFRLAERVSSVTRAVASASEDRRESLAAALSDSTLGVHVDDTMLATDTIPDSEELAELQDILEARLGDVGISDVHVERWEEVPRTAAVTEADTNAKPGTLESRLARLQRQFGDTGAYVASIALKNGDWLNFTVSLSPPSSGWSTGDIALAGLVIAVVLAACLLSLRYLTAPYAVLGGAAERIGRDLTAPPLAEEGPREVRAATQALNIMQRRLQRVIADRDQLVGAIAHDLRTPITRLKLRADYMDDEEQRARMIADLDEIAGMSHSILAFASDNAAPEPRETLDLICLLEVLCADLPTVTLDLPSDAPARHPYFCQPTGLRRCLGNLIDNAVKYGGTARVALHFPEGSIVIRIEDDGPGIPGDELEAVFLPFRRLETSRSRETGGAGLGLTIARTIARAHGGEVHLANRTAGGLRVELVLPDDRGRMSEDRCRRTDVRGQMSENTDRVSDVAL